jgi:hypothetical protein
VPPPTAPPIQWQPRDRPLGSPAAPVSEPIQAYQPFYPPQVVVVQGPPTSGVAVTALILGIIGALLAWCPVAGAVIGFLAATIGFQGMRETKTGARGGRGMAVAGVVLGCLVAVPWIIFFGLGLIGHALDGGSGTGP